MAVTIDKTNAKILATLILEDIHNYIAHCPDEYAAFVVAEKEKEQQPKATVKPRKSRKPIA